jgi:beta-glucosidase
MALDSYAATATDIAAKFPPSFLWGASTSSYQIEGAVNEDGRGRSIWDDFAATPGKTYQGETGAIAIDHYHRYAQDIALMANLGITSYRFSVAWPRIVPVGRGSVNEAGIDFYDRLVDTLLNHNITPTLTLYHWDLPSALYLKGGWLSRDTSYAFADYVEVVFKRLSDRVHLWQTLNEPWCPAFMGYWLGFHAPGHTDFAEAMTVSHYLLLGHGLAVQRMRSLATPAHKLGIVLGLNHVYGVDDSAATMQAILQEDTFMNTWFLDPIFKGKYPGELLQHSSDKLPIEQDDMEIISAPLDFLGTNYYTRALVRGRKRNGQLHVEHIRPVPGANYTETGWEIYPHGMLDLLLRIKSDYAPAEIYITENGSAFQDVVDEDGCIHDIQRRDYLRDHLDVCAEAIRQGVPVKGYYAWSAFDNYEWAEGYSKRFGLIYVDYATQRRIVKDSGHWYHDAIAAYHQRHSIASDAEVEGNR